MSDDRPDMTHDEIPRQSPRPDQQRDSTRAAWDEVSEGFATLGQMIRDRYRAGDEPTIGAADDPKPSTSRQDVFGDPSGDTSGSGSGDNPADAFRRTFDKLIEAAKELGDRASDITHSDEIRSQARQAGRSLTTALSQTVDSIVDDLGELFAKLKSEVTDRQRSASTEPSDAPAGSQGDDDTPIAPV